MNVGMSEAINASAFGGSFNAHVTATTNYTNQNTDGSTLKDLPSKAASV